MRQDGYDVREFDDVFEALGRIAEEGQGALPNWLATHPAPAERVQAAEARATAVVTGSNARVGRDVYLRKIDGLVYGPNPRDGFFREGTFYHPNQRFQITFPRGWQAENLTQAVVAVAPEQRAALQLTMAAGEPGAALQRFFGQAGVNAGRASRETIHGNPTALAEFQAQTEGGVIQGLVAFIAYGERTYQLLGYSSAAQASAYSPAIAAAIRSFAAVTTPAILDVQPQRIDIVNVPSELTVEEFADRYKSSVPADRLAVLNHVQSAKSRLGAGTLVKRVIG